MPDSKSYDLIDGRVVERKTSVETSRVTAGVSFALATHADLTRKGVCFGADLAYRCFPDDPDRIRRADASFIRRERYARISGHPDCMPIPADLVVEVVAPADLWCDVSRRTDDYLGARFRLIWVVSPSTINPGVPPGPIGVPAARARRDQR